MRTMNKLWMVPVAALALIASACTTDSSLDDGGSADVVILVDSLTNPVVTAQTSSGASGSCQASGSFCTIDAAIPMSM